MYLLLLSIAILSVTSSSKKGSDDTNHKKDDGGQTCDAAGGCPVKVKTDYCVLGGGASGMSAAVMAKDKGHKVLVIEKRDLGGHCDTRPAPGGPPVSHKTPNWIEIGVQVIPDTKYANQKFGYNAKNGWTIDTKAWVSRFTTVFPFLESVFVNEHVNYAVDTEHGIVMPIPPHPPNPDFPAAMGRLQAIYQQYPWLDNGIFDGPVPPELMVRWTEFMVTHNLTALIDPLLTIYLYIGGLGSWDLLTAYYALRNLAPTIITQDFQSNFAIDGGCVTYYEGMAKYLGEENVWTQATTTSVVRPAHSGKGNPKSERIHIKGTKNNGTVNFEVECKKLVIAFPQTPTNLAFVDLDETEKAQFSSIKTRVYSDGTVTIEGPINSTNNANFSLSRIDIGNPWKMVNQGIIAIYNQVPYAPSNMYGFSDVPISSADYKSLLQIQLNLVPKSLITNYTIHEVNTHGFYPHPSDAALSDPEGFYTKLRKLQGKRNTFWVGVVQSGFCATHSVLNAVKLLADEYF
jgi:hypothetical protein